MATLKLKKPAGPRSAPAKPERAPVRGSTSGVKKRPTLAEAQASRAEREARYQEQLRQRFGDKPPSNFVRRDEQGAAARPPRRDDRAPDPRRRTNAEPSFASQRQRRDDPQQGARQDARQETRRDPRGPAPAPYNGPRDDGRGPAPRRDARDAPRSRPAAPSGGNTAFGPRNQGPAPRKPAPQRPPSRPSRHSHDDDDDEGTFHPEQPGTMRLSKRMSELGIASRREADEWIPKGWVRVDGRVVSELGSRVLPGQHITIDAKARNAQAMKVTVLINKPMGYVSGQAEDGYEPASVLVTPQNQWREDRSGIRFLHSHMRGLAPAGRLDIDSVGLLVLTQDGRIAKQLIGDDSEVEKEYLVRVNTLDGNALPDSQLALLNHGLELDGEALRPAQVEWVNDDQLRFVLREGKKRQIRRMCELVGLKVLGLKRVRIGQVMLGDLPPGQWRYLRGDERFAEVPTPTP
jgi:23S rRNA pseudouridine2604 synthase